MGWKSKEIKISAFVLTTNNIERQYPFIESIKSWLPVVDELVIVDGHSTDGTVEAIKALNDPKIKLIQDEDTKWEKDWFYRRMGKNFDRGLQECTGDIVVKFDADYILHESSYGILDGKTSFGRDAQTMFNARKLAMRFTRMNFILWNLGYVKSTKTLAINKTRCLEEGIDLHYGLDLKKWGWGYDFINKTHEEHGLQFGDMIRNGNNSYTGCAYICNYDYVFTTEEVAKPMRQSHYLAEVRQRNLDYKTVDNSHYEHSVEEAEKDINICWNKYKEQCISNLRRSVTPVPLEKHPFIIQEKLKGLTPDCQGINAWGWADEI